MAQSKVSDRLGPLDSLFLYVEKKEMPLHIGSVFVFDGPIPIDDLKALIEAKLPKIPRYRQRVQFPPLNAGYPTWEFDSTFDMNRHIQRIRIRPGTQAALEKAAGEIFTTIMDRTRPLWDLTIVDGLPGKRGALIARIHHCLVDGIAGVEMLNFVFNQDREPVDERHGKPFHPSPPPSPAASFADALVSSYSHAVGRLLSLESAALNVAGGIAGELLLGTLNRTISSTADLLRPVERFPFNAPTRGPRHVAWAELPLDPIKAIKDARGVKVNDVFLAILGCALRRYEQLHHVPVERRSIRLMVPVNLRHSGDMQTGNKISLIPVDVPLDVADPLELLANIHGRTEALKHTHAADFVVLGGTFLSAMPVPAQATLVGLLANNVHVLPFNMVSTNVPGPQFPLYLLGRKMLTYYPYVPIGDFMGLSCAMVSYNGAVFFGLTGDSVSAPDVDRLRDFLYEAFEEIRGAAGVSAPRHTPQRRVKAHAK